MSLYVVKNDKGEWLYSDEYNDWVEHLSQATFYDNFEDADDDIECWELSNAYVVELAEAPAKVVVSEEEAKMLEQAKDDYCTASVISAYSTEHIGAMGQDRLMRAYVNGWTVEKPKRYGVWVPHVKGKMYFKDGRGGDGLDIASADCLNEANQQFTAAEIEHYDLQNYEKVEVKN